MENRKFSRPSYLGVKFMGCIKGARNGFTTVNKIIPNYYINFAKNFLISLGNFKID